MEKYLLTYTLDGTAVAHMVFMRDLAEIVGMSDCTGATGFRAYRLTSNKQGYVDLEKLSIHDHYYIDEDGKWKNAGCVVFLYDQEENFVDSHEYPDH